MIKGREKTKEKKNNWEPLLLNNVRGERGGLAGEKNYQNYCLPTTKRCVVYSVGCFVDLVLLLLLVCRYSTANHQTMRRTTMMTMMTRRWPSFGCSSSSSLIWNDDCDSGSLDQIAKMIIWRIWFRFTADPQNYVVDSFFLRCTWDRETSSKNPLRCGGKSLRTRNGAEVESGFTLRLHN